MATRQDGSNRQLGSSRSSAVRFIILIGLVSLFADMTYEGARSITGPFLGSLGASAAVVGIVAGFGELFGYGLRLAAGYLADRTGRYWAITFAGYALNLVAVPLLALADQWVVAAALIVAERAGRAIRSPARDAMLSHACSGVGLGWGFGLHEAMDQVGAVLGPLIVALVIYLDGGYRTGFAVLAIPAALAIVVLALARWMYPRPSDLDAAPPALQGAGLPGRYWLYVAGAALVGAGFADFPLIAFHVESVKSVEREWIPAFYSLAMAADAVAALALGRLFDRIGLRTMVSAAAISLPAVPLAFFGGPVLVAVGMILWGVGMGAQESIMRAVIAAMTPVERRGSAYGVFGAIFGAAWFAGSALLGVLYDQSVLALVIASLALQFAALPVLWRSCGPQPPSRA